MSTNGGIARCKVAPAKFLKTRCPQQQLWVPSRGDRGLSLLPRAEPRCAPRRPPSEPPGPPAACPGAPRLRPHLLAVRGRALLPQAAPVQQVSRLQVQGAGPRQERPGRATVGAHGSGRRRGPGAPRPQAGKEAAPQAQRPRPESRARGCLPRAAGPRPALGPGEAGGGGGGAAAREGRAGAAAPAAAAAAGE